MTSFHPLSRFPRRRRSARSAVIVAFLATLAVAGLGACAPEGTTDEGSAAGDAADGSTVLARVGDDVITRADAEKAAAEQLEQIDLELERSQIEAKQRRHDILETEARRLVQDRILEAEAGERGVTREQLLAAEVESRLGAVTPEEVEAFYEQNRGQIGNQPREQVIPQIESYLRQQRQAAAYEAFMTDLEAKHEVAYEVEPYRAELDVEGEPSKGPADAPVTIVEFSDFECPFCSRVVPALDQVEESYGDKVRIVFKQFPLTTIHPQAQKAAEASLCAAEQDKFWELHDAMFAAQDKLAVADLEATARELGLDGDAFAECVASGRHADAVKADQREGALAGVSGTPALFINGRLISGVVPYAQLAEVIDEELARR